MLITDEGKLPPNSVWAVRVTLHPSKGQSVVACSAGLRVSRGWIKYPLIRKKRKMNTGKELNKNIFVGVTHFLIEGGDRGRVTL